VVGYWTLVAQSFPSVSPFRSPVDFEFRLSGGFNELRETHFHTGIDIKPSDTGKDDKIYCVASGFISRIKVSAGGYGYALYVDHPEYGYTSVYAHLQAYHPRIAHIMQSYQSKKESFEIDVSLPRDVLPVQKGEILGIMGNSGYSFGKHLHFEMRDTKTEKPINPFHLGFTVRDNIAPSVLSVSVHGLDQNFYKLCDINVPISAEDHQNIILAEPIEVPASNVGLAIQAFDRADGSHNKTGLYALHVYADELLVYSFHMDKISFTETHNVVGFYDYKWRKKNGDTHILCYKYPGNSLEFLRMNGNGVICLDDHKATNVRMETEDFYKNRRTILFKVQKAANIKESIDFQDVKQWVFVNNEAEIAQNNVRISIGKNALFRNLPFTLKEKPYAGHNTVYQIHDENEPLKSGIDLMIKPDIILTKWKKNAIITWTSENGKKYNYGGYWKDGFVQCRINDFGSYTVEYDTLAPIIRAIDFKSNVGTKSSFKFELKDDFAVKGRDADEMSYKVWINDIVVISPYNLKSSLLEVPISDLKAGTYTLRMEVRDHCGNKTTFKKTFSKKN
jgi:hypothetical protein